ncbi:MAG: hypothetical protein DWQ07_19110 [Chloroflexi bacterium]|nr:MAG: hypothetical protein DWQ07_19110 [Chloroflexota bacterium]MBL1195043.1 hypothetical protein [Chloroflexota bacterium]NOH12331.1 hypothetical protein [Chloroflexota bacterium]
MQNEPLEVTLLVTGTLEKLDIPYFITGSLGSALYGMVRSTQDADIVAAMRPEHTQAFLNALQDEFFLDEEMIANATEQGTSFNIIHRNTMFKVDVFIPPPDPFQQSQFERTQQLSFSLERERSANFASPEDIILSKLDWYRSGGEISERQWRDVLGVIKTRSVDLDKEYLTRWAHELKVHDLLARALGEAGEQT